MDSNQDDTRTWEKRPRLGILSFFGSGGVALMILLLLEDDSWGGFLFLGFSEEEEEDEDEEELSIVGFPSSIVVVAWCRISESNNLDDRTFFIIGEGS